MKFVRWIAAGLLLLGSVSFFIYGGLAASVSDEQQHRTLRGDEQNLVAAAAKYVNDFRASHLRLLILMKNSAPVSKELIDACKNR